MVESTRSIDIVATIIMAIAIIFAVGPFYLVITTASSSFEATLRGIPLVPGNAFLDNLTYVLTQTLIPRQIFNSLVVALIVTAGKGLVSFISAFALVYFDMRGKAVIFAVIVATLMLPLEMRIVPSYAVAANLFSPFQSILDAIGVTGLIEATTGFRPAIEINILNSYLGIALPLVATATGTFLFRQFFLSIPRELAQAARIDGAGPFRFMVDILAPLSVAPLGALSVIMFLGAWNQYLWPLMVTTDPGLQTAVIGLAQFDSAMTAGQAPLYHTMMTATLLVIIPPLLVIALMQRLIMRGLALGEK